MKEKVIQSVDRAIQILELFNLSVAELSIKEISEQMQLPKSTIHGLIKTLEYRGYIEQNLENQKYKLGLKLFELGNIVSTQMDIRKLAYPIIAELVQHLNETVHLVVRDGDEVVYVEKVEGQGTLRMYSQIGKRAPLHCTGVGKAILAYMESEEIDELLSSIELVSFTSKTITDIEKLNGHLELIRKQGYAIDDEEIELGLKCVAAPIFNYEGKVTASISCAGPINRIAGEKLEIIISHVQQAAIEISKKMGYRGA